MIDICVVSIFFTSMNKAAMNILYKSFSVLFVYFSWLNTKSGVTESYPKFTLNFISNFQFSEGVLSFYSIARMCESSGYFTCLQYFLLSVSVIQAILMFVKW